MSTCNCEVCMRSEKFTKLTEDMSDTHKAVFWELYDILLHSELDLGYYKSLVDGSWPDADTVIHRVRNRKEKRAEVQPPVAPRKTFVSNIQLGNRRADISLKHTENDGTEFIVDMFENNSFINSVLIVNKSIYFAQDAAENWVTSVTK